MSREKFGKEKAKEFLLDAILAVGILVFCVRFIFLMEKIFDFLGWPR